MSEKPKPVKCRQCGRRPHVRHDNYLEKPYGVECDDAACWWGARHATEEGAVKLWDKVMEVKDDRA